MTRDALCHTSEISWKHDKSQILCTVPLLVLSKLEQSELVLSVPLESSNTTATPTAA